MQRKNHRKQRISAALLLLGALGGCVDANAIALRVGAPPDNAAQLRAIQIERFDTLNENQLLSDATQALQDLGFTVIESAPRAGVLAGAKQRDAREAGQVAAAVVLSVAAAFLGVITVPTWDANQVILVTLTTRPLHAERRTELRASFERVVFTNHGGQRVEALDQPEMHREFFNILRSGMASSGGVRS